MIFLFLIQLEDRMADLKNKVESVQQGTVIEMAEYNTLMNNWSAEVGAKIFILSKELPVKSYSQISELSTALIGLLARFKEAISNPSNDVNYIIKLSFKESNFNIKRMVLWGTSLLTGIYL